MAEKGKPSQRLNSIRFSACVRVSNATTFNPSITDSENTPWQNTLQDAAVPAMALRQTFARNLRNIRKARGLSQEELAHQADLDRTYISALERSVYAASIDVIEKIANVLNVSPPELFANHQVD